MRVAEVEAAAAGEGEDGLDDGAAGAGDGSERGVQIIDMDDRQRCRRGFVGVALQAEIDIAPNLLSYHLKVLRDAGLVVGTRRGRWIDYTLTDDAQAWVKAALPGELGRW